MSPYVSSVERNVERQVVGFGEHCLEIGHLDADHCSFGGGCLIHAAPRRDDAHPARLRTARELLRGRPESDDAERPGREPPDVERPVPRLRELALEQKLLHLRVPPMQGEDQAHRMVGHFGHAEVRNVCDRDAALGRSGDRDLVGAIAQSRDYPAVFEPVDHRLWQFDRDREDRVGVVNVLKDLVRVVRLDFEGREAVVTVHGALIRVHRQHLGVQPHHLKSGRGRPRCPSSVSFEHDGVAQSADAFDPDLHNIPGSQEALRVARDAYA